MKKILFVNDELTTGGVTNVLFNLLNNLDKDKYQIDLLILNRKDMNIDQKPEYVNLIETTSFFDVCGVTVQECWQMGIGKFIKKCYLYLLIKTGFIHQKIKKERAKMNLCDYDTEIAFKEGFSSIFVGNSKAQNKINWIHSDYKVKNYSRRYINTMTKVFNGFNMHVAVSKVAMNSFKEIFLVDKICVIHNIINVERIKDLMKEEVDYKVSDDLSLISVGRLHPQKSYDRLLNVVSRLNKDGFKFQLYLIGGGILKDQLFEQKDRLHLSNVHFLLEQKNPFKYLKQADLFVLSSLYEGLPTVVYESFICGVPVISTEVAGVDEQINKDNGMIVKNDEESLYEALKYLLENKTLLAQYKENLKDYAYENEMIIKRIEEII